MSNTEMRMTPPPIPDAAKKREAPDSVKKESAEQVIPDLTSEAVLEDDAIATKNLEYRKQIQADLEEEAIEDARKRVNETGAASDDLEKKWFEAGDNMAAKAIEKEASAETTAALNEVRKLQEDREKADMLAGVVRSAKNAYDTSTEAGRAKFDASIKESMDRLSKQTPEAQETSIMESSRDFIAKDVEAMEKSLNEKFGVDVTTQSSKGLLGRIGFGFRNMISGDLRRAMGDYRAKLDQLNKLSENIDERKMTKSDWSKRDQRAFLHGIDRKLQSGSTSGKGK